MMNDEEPKIAAARPAVLELEPGTYYWCSCGKSAGQPFCDGSHKGSRFSPVEIVVAEKKKLSLCNCKRSKRGYLCDGSHKVLRIGDE